MTVWTPTTHIPFQWFDAPSRTSPLNAADLIAAETDLVDYIRTLSIAYDTYAEAQFLLAAQNGSLLGNPPIGAVLPYAGSGDPPDTGWVIADGRLIDRTIYTTFYTRVGHAYNGGIDPGGSPAKVRIPDKRGRKSVGAINMGTSAGAGANDNAHGQWVRGAAGGEVNHQTLLTESAPHTHGGLTTSGNTGGQSAQHAHNISLNTAPETAEHTHGWGAWSTGANTRHVHPCSGGYYLQSSGGILWHFFANGGTAIFYNPAQNDAPDHAHYSSGSTGGRSATHTHTINGSSGGYDTDHHHTVQLGINSDGGSGGAAVAHNNLDPYQADTYIVRIA